MASRISPGFRSLLESFSFEDIERHDGSVYGLWPDFRLAYFNPAWERFARENGAAAVVSSEEYLETSILEVTAEVLRPFYRRLFHSCLDATQTTRRPIQHTYECSSAELFREFVMTLYRLPRGEGLLVVNSLVVEGPHDPGARVSQTPDKQRYMDEHGLIHQCTHCRRVLHPGRQDRWDWIPAWVEHIPVEASHTLCRFCLGFYYLNPAEGNLAG